MPLKFQEQNLFSKIITKFQLEVENQLVDFVRDAPKRIYEERGVQGVVMYYLKYLIGAYLYNELFERITGHRATLDPLGMTEDFVSDLTGYRIANKFDWGDIYKNGLVQQKEKPKTYKAILNFAQDVGSELPFFGTLLGGSGRFPLQGVLPDGEKMLQNATNLVTGEDGSRLDSAKNIGLELAQTAAYGLPIPGLAQGIKTIKGAADLVKGDVRNSSGELQYPVEQSGGNIGRGLIFGRSGFDETRRYWDSNGNPLSEAQTAVYDARVSKGENPQEVYDELLKERAESQAQTEGQSQFYEKVDSRAESFALADSVTALYEEYKAKDPDAASLDVPKADSNFSVAGFSKNLSVDETVRLQNLYTKNYTDAISGVMEDQSLSSDQKYKIALKLRSMVAADTKHQFAIELSGGKVQAFQYTKQMYDVTVAAMKAGEGAGGRSSAGRLRKHSVLTGRSTSWIMRRERTSSARTTAFMPTW